MDSPVTPGLPDGCSVSMVAITPEVVDNALLLVDLFHHHSGRPTDKDTKKYSDRWVPGKGYWMTPHGGWMEWMLKDQDSMRICSNESGYICSMCMLLYYFIGHDINGGHRGEKQLDPSRQ
jgi:hypothetical protein